MTQPFPPGFSETLPEIVRMAETAGLDWMLLGAIPVGYWGWPRATTDLDFAISVDVSGSGFTDGWMASLGFSKDFGPREIEGKGIWLSKYWKKFGKKSLGVDIFFSVGEWQNLAMARRIKGRLDDREWWLPSLEDLLLYKLLAYRKKDILDLSGIIDRRYVEIDWAYLHEWASHLDVHVRLFETIKHHRQEHGIVGPYPWE